MITFDCLPSPSVENSNDLESTENHLCLPLPFSHIPRGSNNDDFEECQEGELGPLEVKVDSMLEKLTLLERVEKMIHKWEDSGRSIPVEQKRDKSVFSEAPKGGMGMTPLEEGSSRTKSSIIATLDLSRKEPSQSQTSKSGEGRRVEALTHRLEMPVF